MKINEKSQIGLYIENSDVVKTKIILDISKQIDNFNQRYFAPTLNNVLFSKVDNYLITDNALKTVIDKIKLPDTNKLQDVIKTHRRYIFLMGNIAIKVFSEIFENNTPVLLILSYFKSNNHIGVNFTFMNLLTGEIEALIKDDNTEELINKTIKLLLFVDYADPEIYITGITNRKIKSNGVKYLNETKYDIKIVDSHWNKYVIKIEDYKVKGHFRLQPYGEKRTKRKLIWIKDFIKHQYIKNPGKERK